MCVLALHKLMQIEQTLMKGIIAAAHQPRVFELIVREAMDVIVQDGEVTTFGVQRKSLLSYSFAEHSRQGETVHQQARFRRRFGHFPDPETAAGAQTRFRTHGGRVRPKRAPEVRFDFEHAAFDGMVSYI